MDLKQIEKLMLAMENSRIKRIALKKEDFEIEIERECTTNNSSISSSPPVYLQPLPAAGLHEQRPSPVIEPASEGATKSASLFITSPMVGTFYSSPSPDDPPFIKAGDVISEDTVVCIIEAMKVMNEVKAGVKGVVAECMVKNGEPVEFGTQIFRVNQL